MPDVIIKELDHISKKEEAVEEEAEEKNLKFQRKSEKLSNPYRGTYAEKSFEEFKKVPPVVFPDLTDGTIMLTGPTA